MGFNRETYNSNSEVNYFTDVWQVPCDQAAALAMFAVAIGMYDTMSDAVDESTGVLSGKAPYFGVSTRPVVMANKEAKIKKSGGYTWTGTGMSYPAYPVWEPTGTPAPRFISHGQNSITIDPAGNIIEINWFDSQGVVPLTGTLPADPPIDPEKPVDPCILMGLPHLLVLNLHNVPPTLRGDTSFMKLLPPLIQQFWFAGADFSGNVQDMDFPDSMYRVEMRGNGALVGDLSKLDTKNLCELWLGSFDGTLERTATLKSIQLGPSSSFNRGARMHCDKYCYSESSSNNCPDL